MTTDDSLAQLIDERVQKVLANQKLGVTAMGTVMDSDATSIFLNVSFDGDGTLAPVKCFWNIRPAPGDRVGLAKFGSDWIVMGGYGDADTGNRPLPKIYGSTGTAAVGSTASATMSDMPGPISITYTKLHDKSNTFFMMATSFWIHGNTNTGVVFEINATHTDGTVVQISNCGGSFNNTAESHESWAENRLSVGLTRRGVWTCKLQWAVMQGLATLEQDLTDRYSFHCMEVSG